MRPKQQQIDLVAEAAKIIAGIKPGQLVYVQGAAWDKTKGKGTNEYFDVPRPLVVTRVTPKTVFTDRPGALVDRRLSANYINSEWFATFAAYKAHHAKQLKKEIAKAQKELAALEAFQPPTAKQVLKLVG